MKLNDITIKMMDIYEAEEKFKLSVINKIEGQIIMEDADSVKYKNMLDQEHMFSARVSNLDTFRGGIEFKLYNTQSYYRISIVKFWSHVQSTNRKAISR